MICRRYGKDDRTLTFTQYFLYLKAAGKAHLQEFKERAIAARAANATQDGWEEFMRSFDADKRKAAQAELLEKIENAEPVSGIPEDIILGDLIPAEDNG